MPMGCSRRDSNPRYVVEGHESLTGLDYGSTGSVARAPESLPPLMSFRVRGGRAGPLGDDASVRCPVCEGRKVLGPSLARDRIDGLLRDLAGIVPDPLEVAGGEDLVGEPLHG